MAGLEAIKKKIRDIAGRRRNVTYDEIKWVVDQLGPFCDVHASRAKHGTLFRVDNQRFIISPHNPGSKQVRSYAVDSIVNAMIELGLYEE